MNRQGMEMWTMLKILLWVALILIFAYLIKTLVVDAGTSVAQVDGIVP